MRGRGPIGSTGIRSPARALMVEEDLPEHATTGRLLANTHAMNSHDGG
jgi:hypothetical protein